MSRFKDFIAAIKKGESENARRLFERKYIDKREFGLTALHSACWYNNDVMVKYLLSEGCGIEDDSPAGWRPIHFAACEGHITVMKSLIEAGCSLECVTKVGETPLAVAMKYERDDCANILRSSSEKQITMGLLKENSLSMIVDIERGKTLLEQLLHYPDPDIMNAVLSKKVDEQEINDWLSLKLQKVDAQSYRLLHECLLWRCIHQKYDDGVYALCTAEIVNIDSLFMGSSPLETAVEFGTVYWVKHILEKLEQEDDSWVRAAKIAKDKNLSNISSLISERINYLHSKKKIGFSRLHVAVLDNDPDMVMFLLSNTIINKDEVHKIFGTAISLAYSLNQVECFQILQNNNVNVNIVDRLGQSPLHIAITNKIDDHCDYLVNNITNLEAKDYMNFTVLERAVMNDRENMCELLVKRGARCDKYMDCHALLDINLDLVELPRNAPVLPITMKETIHSLCLKMNRTVYPCLMKTIDKDAIIRTDGEDNTILHLCAISLKPRLCSEMILKSANVNSINKSESTPLMELLKYNYGRNMEQIENDLIETVNILVNGGSSVNVKDIKNRNVIDRATEFHSEKLLLALIQKKERLEFVHLPELSTWCRYKYFTMIKEAIPLLSESLLTEWITKDLIRDMLNKTDISLAKILYDHASNVVKTTVVETILYKIASDGDQILFENMVQEKMSTNCSLECGESLLTCLIRDRKEEFIKLLIRSKNASLFLEKGNAKKKLPLHICIECDYWEVIDPLILDTKSVNEEDIDGNTPLSLLLEKLSETTEERTVDRLINFVKMLIKQSADIYKVNKNNKVVISYCTTSHIKSKIESYFRQHQQCQIQSPNINEKESSTRTDPSREPVALSQPICSICVSEPINCVLNCGHAFCMTCAEQVIKCFVCRTLITAKLKMYL